MSLTERFSAACMKFLVCKRIGESHAQAILGLLMNDPRTAVLLETLREGEIENAAVTAVQGKAVLYFADGDGSKDEDTATEFKKKIHPIQHQKLLTREMAAQKRIDSRNAVKENGRHYADRMVRRSGISRTGRCEGLKPLSPNLWLSDCALAVDTTTARIKHRWSTACTPDCWVCAT